MTAKRGWARRRNQIRSRPETSRAGRASPCHNSRRYGPPTGAQIRAARRVNGENTAIAERKPRSPAGKATTIRGRVATRTATVRHKQRAIHTIPQTHKHPHNAHCAILSANRKGRFLIFAKFRASVPESQHSCGRNAAHKRGGTRTRADMARQIAVCTKAVIVRPPTAGEYGAPKQPELMRLQRRSITAATASRLVSSKFSANVLIGLSPLRKGSHALQLAHCLSIERRRVDYKNRLAFSNYSNMSAISSMQNCCYPFNIAPIWFLLPAMLRTATADNR